MKIIISNNKSFLASNRMPYLPGCAVIACTSDMLMPERFDWYDEGKRIVLSFDDVEDPGHVNAFTSEQARQVRQLICQWRSKKIEKVYVCCDSGESRSAAVAAAVKRFLAGDGNVYKNRLSPQEKDVWCNPHYHPNILVYDLMCKAFHMKTTKLGLFIRGRTSRNALRKAIRESRS